MKEIDTIRTSSGEEARNKSFELLPEDTGLGMKFVEVNGSERTVEVCFRNLRDSEAFSLVGSLIRILAKNHHLDKDFMAGTCLAMSHASERLFEGDEGGPLN